MCNYRLTSMIIFFKTIRKIQANKFFKNDKLLSIDQFDFRLGLWTEEAIFSLLNIYNIIVLSLIT